MAKLGNEKTRIVCVVFCFFLTFVFARATSNHGRFDEELEVEKLLEKLNKPAVKSIKSPDGDMIDCVNILNQPAFDNPKLKNHKVQMRPTFHSRKSNISNRIAQLWHQSGSCPKGTVPIRRTTKEDILRADSIQQFWKKINQSIPDLFGSSSPISGHEYAIADLRGDRYYGAQASINIWKPHVQESNEFSLSQIWIVNRDDPNNNVETIEAGWQIYPGIYGDDNPRLFTYWTSDSYRSTGCYNLRCSGFVQVDNTIAVESSLQTLSVYGGSQYELSILIRKDQGTGNWWMQVGNSKNIGYWPASLFNRLSESASNVQWGGEIVNRKSNGQHTTTEMGSGHFSEEGFGKASYFKELSIVDANNNLVSPKSFNPYISNPTCYTATPYGYSDDSGCLLLLWRSWKKPKLSLALIM
ncbi:uncharacterized protein LOC129314149 [Prosopis cineraria]|uniref:uncharacterized protein LOC129314149 n=1 Tax=Prosopis cineraria TaxID=364024 RepID=UPI0024100CE8|nr:uncharacterized protein LOC129314149 [Prosopis cineraria]